MANELINPWRLARELSFASPYHQEVRRFDRDAMKARRRVLGLTQEQLGKLVGYTGGGRVSQFETGFDTPSVGQVGRIARALGLCCWCHLVPDDVLVEYLLEIRDLDHPSDEARVWWAHARVAEYRGDMMRCDWFLDLAVLFEKIEGDTRA